MSTAGPGVTAAQVIGARSAQGAELAKAWLVPGVAALVHIVGVELDPVGVGLGGPGGSVPCLADGPAAHARDALERKGVRKRLTLAAAVVCVSLWVLLFTEREDMPGGRHRHAGVHRDVHVAHRRHDERRRAGDRVRVIGADVEGGFGVVTGKADRVARLKNGGCDGDKAPVIQALIGTCRRQSPRREAVSLA